MAHRPEDPRGTNILPFPSFGKRVRHGLGEPFTEDEMAELQRAIHRVRQGRSQPPAPPEGPESLEDAICYAIDDWGEDHPGLTLGEIIDALAQITADLTLALLPPR